MQLMCDVAWRGEVGGSMGCGMWSEGEESRIVVKMCVDDADGGYESGGHRQPL